MKQKEHQVADINASMHFHASNMVLYHTVENFCNKPGMQNPPQPRGQ